jgi:DNA-binding NarL/FixJ family response regulator
MKLNEKEKRFIELKAQGLTNKEISMQIYRSTSTINKFVKHLLTKTGCRNTHNLIAWYFDAQKIND